jgi:glycosyltransferase involved in cell wall biosynthesis
MLVAGSAGEIKRRLKVPVVVTLQGDDIFLNDVIEPYKTQALAAIRKLDATVDAYLVNSRYYADAMSAFMGLSREKFHILPLGIDTKEFAALEREENDHPPTIGYLARLAPEKGLHLLADAFIRLKKMPGMERAQLQIAGWLGAQHKKYAEESFAMLRAAGLADSFKYWGEVDRQQKLQFLQAIDVLSVPTPYQEPKGLFVLEALAAGVPVVQPAHGAFPELLEATGGGLLVPAEDRDALAEGLHALLLDASRRRELGALGRAAVLENFHAAAIAQRTIAVLERIAGSGTPEVPTLRE